MIYVVIKICENENSLCVLFENIVEKIKFCKKRLQTIRGRIQTIRGRLIFDDQFELGFLVDSNQELFFD